MAFGDGRADRGQDHATDAGAKLEDFLALHASVCAQAGVEPLPDNEARAMAKKMMALPVPAFEVEFQLGERLAELECDPAPESGEK